MKFSRITYAKCPKCELLLNDFRLYNLNMLMCGHPFYHEMECPGCSTKFAVRAKTTLEFITAEEESNDQNPTK